MFDDETVNRFWSNVDVRGPDECWDWKAGKSASGYGSLSIAGVMHYAHRIAWSLANGREIPEGLVVRHACDRRVCTNPAHLLIGTKADNTRDMMERGRWIEPPRCRGSNHHNSKLAEEDVVKIRHMLSRGEKQKAIGERFGITQAAVSLIAKGHNWAWLEDEE